MALDIAFRLKEEFRVKTSDSLQAHLFQSLNLSFSTHNLIDQVRQRLAHGARQLVLLKSLCEEKPKVETVTERPLWPWELTNKRNQ